MFDWLSSVANAVVFVVIGALAFIGIGANPTDNTDTRITNDLQVQLASTTEEQIQALQSQLENERNERLKLQDKIYSAPLKTNPETSVPPLLKTTISNTSSPTVVAGARALSGEEIYSLISPSVVLISTNGGGGSGFVIADGRYTITNQHVVDGHKNVTLTFSNGATMNAPVLGEDLNWDIAIIYNGNNRPTPVKTGSSDSSSLKVGSDIYVLGYPTVTSSQSGVIVFTKGVVSANRQNVDGQNYIQADAVTRPGNSGGPVVNSRGEVVGVHSAGIRNLTGVAFSIPIETALNLVPRLSQYGQSRYEVYPIGSRFDIRESVLLQMQLNDKILTCTQLNLKGDDLTACEFYRNYPNDYNWNILKGQ